MSLVEQALRRTGAWGRADGDESPRPGENGGAQRSLSIDEYPIEPPTAAPPAIQARRGGDEPPSLPAAAHDRRADRGARSRAERLVLQGAVSPSTAEQYRRLAATLYQAQADTGISTVMLSSALPREGKTLTTANLAITLSESYRQSVLLIDTDLRGASIHTFFGLSMSPGLGEFLERDGAVPPIVPVSKTLSVLPAGATMSNPIAGLVSDRMKELLQYAKDRFDWVLLDTPPVALLSDANLLGRLTDTVVFVVAAGSTPYKVVRRAIATVGPERVLGVVLNKASDDVLPESTYYQHYSSETPMRRGV